MRKGSHVVFLPDPLLYAVGVVLSVRDDGYLLIEWDRFEDNDKPCRSFHDPHEVDFDALRTPTDSTPLTS